MMKFPFVRRSRHRADLACLEARLETSAEKLERAHATVSRHKASLEELRRKRAGELDELRKVIRIAETRAAELDQLQMRLAAMETDEMTRAALDALEGIRGWRDRRLLLALSLHGRGIEIGALHHPLSVPADAEVRYVDLRTREENIAKFPEVPADQIVETTYVCDGQSLAAVDDESQDFVIANHVLEHFVNPLAAIENFLRVLKPKGKLFLSVPDKRFSFDFRREVTPWEHVLDDYRQKREVEDREVYERYRRDVDASIDPDRAVAGRLEIHHHAWTQGEFLELCIELRRQLGWPVEIDLFARQGLEVTVVLEKDDPPHRDHGKREA